MSASAANPSSSAGGSGGAGGGGPCGACKFLRRKCVSGCIFAPYFDSDQGAAHFAAVHKVFGASNVSKLLLNVPVHKRLDAVVTICYEAQARLRDPVYGCVGHIFALQQQVINLEAQLTFLQAHLANLELSSPPPPLPMITSSATGSSSMPYDLFSLLDPSMAQQSGWGSEHLRQPPVDPRQPNPNGFGSSMVNGNSELHSLACEFLGRQVISANSTSTEYNNGLKRE